MSRDSVVRIYKHVLVKDKKVHIIIGVHIVMGAPHYKTATITTEQQTNQLIGLISDHINQ